MTWAVWTARESSLATLGVVLAYEWSATRELSSQVGTAESAGLRGRGMEIHWVTLLAGLGCRSQKWLAWRHDGVRAEKGSERRLDIG